MEQYTDKGIYQSADEKSWRLELAEQYNKVRESDYNKGLQPDTDVYKPDHYMIRGAGGEELCEVRDIQRHCSAELCGLQAGDMNNAIKYLLRSPFKGETLKDLKKARFMINKLIDSMEE
jgi:hypothetical protein